MSDEALQELNNIANAKRFDRETFADDTEFADWAQSRARHTLARAAYPSANVAWRCFHCDGIFTDEAKAREHFGTSQMHVPACTIDAAEYRAMEARMHAYNDEDAAIHRQMAKMQCEHSQALRREEEKGYARGVADGMKEFAANVAQGAEAVPCGWIRSVESYVPGEPTEWNVEFSWGDDEPEDDHRWEPVYRAPPAQPADAAQGAEAVADVEHRIPAGWRLYAADFSVSGSPGHVTLIRDDQGKAWWHGLTDEEREKIDLFITGRGKTIREAIDAALTAAQSGDKS